MWEGGEMVEGLGGVDGGKVLVSFKGQDNFSLAVEYSANAAG